MTVSSPLNLALWRSLDWTEAVLPGAALSALTMWIGWCVAFGFCEPEDVLADRKAIDKRFPGLAT